MSMWYDVRYRHTDGAGFTRYKCSVYNEVTNVSCRMLSPHINVKSNMCNKVTNTMHRTR